MTPALSPSQAIALMGVRVSLGSLLFWVGLARVSSPTRGLSVRAKFHGDQFDQGVCSFSSPPSKWASGCW